MDFEILREKTIDNIKNIPDSQIKKVYEFTDQILGKLDDIILTQHLQEITQNSQSFEFLKEEGDIYSVEDLKVSFK